MKRVKKSNPIYLPRKTIIEILNNLIKEFFRTLPKERKRKKRGRPREYKEEVIILAMLVKVIFKYSLREVEVELRSVLRVKVTLQVQEGGREGNERVFSIFGEEMERGFRETMIADGKGFGYGDVVYMKLAEREERGI